MQTKTKKEIRIQLETISGPKISRSEAREALRDTEDFGAIIFDFDNVPVVGQDFADEIYRVFQNKHPDIEIKEDNMAGGVRFMVERARNEAKIEKYL
jgi:hypothetical protein